MEASTVMRPLSSAAELRLRAEERMGERTPELYLPQNQEATRRIVHELEVHQIELVMQNEELRQARYEVETALEKYIDLYEYAPAGYFTLDRSGIITALNLAAAVLLRIERSLLIGRSFEQLISIEFRSAFPPFLQSVFTGHSNAACETVILNNVELPVIVQIRAALGTSGKECHLVLIHTPGQRQRAPQQERERQSTTLPPVENNMEELELCVFSLREALISSMLILEKRVQKSGLKILLTLTPEVDERIVADQGKLKQIILALLSNAVKFSPVGDTVELLAVKEGENIRFTVADTGPGIKTEVLPALFEPGAGPESDVVRENGEMNLILTGQMVERLGGSIWVESGAGTGSRFCFTIPFRDCSGTI